MARAPHASTKSSKMPNRRRNIGGRRQLSAHLLADRGDRNNASASDRATNSPSSRPEAAYAHAARECMQKWPTALSVCTHFNRFVRGDTGRREIELWPLLAAYFINAAIDSAY